MPAKDKALRIFMEWYNSLAAHKASGGPARGTIAVALQVLDRLKENYSLNLEAHRAQGKAQIKGAGPANLARILALFGETRLFLKEGGRTNRGGPGDIEPMLESLRAAGLEALPDSERVECITEMQKFLVDRIKEFHGRRRLELAFDPSKSTWQTICDLLLQAKENGKEGPVAQYLVGAKLQIRFPDITVGNESSSTADDQLGRQGDFYIGDTAFHVTVAPMAGVIEKCKRNIASGLRCYLLVPDRLLAGTRQFAESAIPNKIAVESIESFVSQNIEEISKFSKTELLSGLRKLLLKYNERVDSVETDKSMMIEMPRGLK
jgi:hypothetical protein